MMLCGELFAVVKKPGPTQFSVHVGAASPRYSISEVKNSLQDIITRMQYWKRSFPFKKRYWKRGFEAETPLILISIREKGMSTYLVLLSNRGEVPNSSLLAWKFHYPPMGSIAREFMVANLVTDGTFNLKPDNIKSLCFEDVKYIRGC